MVVLLLLLLLCACVFEVASNHKKQTKQKTQVRIGEGIRRYRAEPSQGRRGEMCVQCIPVQFYCCKSGDLLFFFSCPSFLKLMCRGGNRPSLSACQASGATLERVRALPPPFFPLFFFLRVVFRVQECVEELCIWKRYSWRGATAWIGGGCCRVVLLPWRGCWKRFRGFVLLFFFFFCEGPHTLTMTRRFTGRIQGLKEGEIIKKKTQKNEQKI